jgi:hypothetical protein
MNEDYSIDNSMFNCTSYSNTNALQCAACEGDVQLLERLVGMGAALDYSADNLSAVSSRSPKKPPGCTPLLLAVVHAFFSRLCIENEPNGEEMWRKTFEGTVECAIQLVRLGANVDVKLHLPVGRDANSETYQVMKAMKLDGKTVRELATDVGSELLVQTIESLSSKEDRIKLVNCRCGSRMPWKECHSGKKTDRYYDETDRYYDERRDQDLNWKFSPLAPCPCKKSNKIYFKCCWEESFREYFQDDETTTLSVSATMPINDDNRNAVMNMYHNFRDPSLSPTMQIGIGILTFMRG